MHAEAGARPPTEKPRILYTILAPSHPFQAGISSRRLDRHACLFLFPSCRGGFAPVAIRCVANP